MLASLKQLSVSKGSQPATVWGTEKGSATCAYLTGGNAAIGGCLELGTNLVAIGDGGTYVWGLAAPTVGSARAEIGGESFTGTVDAGTFIIEIPDGSHGTAPIDLLVSAGSSATMVSLPGIPKPLP